MAVDFPIVPERARQDSMARADSLWLAEKSLRDSLDRIRWAEEAERESERYNALPFLSEQEAVAWEPVVKNWLDFYGIDIRKMKHCESREWDFYAEPDTTSIYYCPFTPEDDNGSLPAMQYSPDRRRYVDPDLPTLTLEEDGRYHYYGGDDCTGIYLTDRLMKVKGLILWGGSSTCLEGVFWKDNDSFALVGSGYYSADDYFLQVYDLGTKSIALYEIEPDEEREKRSYKVEVFFREEGIVNH